MRSPSEPGSALGKINYVDIHTGVTLGEEVRPDEAHAETVAFQWYRLRDFAYWTPLWKGEKTELD